MSENEHVERIGKALNTIIYEARMLARELAEAEALGEVVANDRLICGERLDEAEAQVRQCAGIIADRYRELAEERQRRKRLSAAYRGQMAINRAYRNRTRHAQPPQWAFDAINRLHPGDLPDTDKEVTDATKASPDTEQ